MKYFPCLWEVLHTFSGRRLVTSSRVAGKEWSVVSLWLATTGHSYPCAWKILALPRLWQKLVGSGLTAAEEDRGQGRLPVWDA